MTWLWLLDRSSALGSYALLWLAVLTGIFYNTRNLGALHRASRQLHVPVSVLASMLFVLHGIVGSIDGWMVWTGQAPHPSYSDAYLLIGLGVGAASLLLLVTAFLAFTDPRRFERPWNPRIVHLFAYGGFALATIHGVAIGTDLVSLIGPGLSAAIALLVYALGVRFVANRIADWRKPSRATSRPARELSSTLADAEIGGPPSTLR